MTTLSKILSGIIVVLVIALGFFFFTAKAPTKLGAVYGNPSNVNTFVTASTTSVVANYPVVLHTVTLGSIAGDVVTIYNTASTTLATTSNIMAVVTEGTTTQSLTFDGAYNAGITYSQTATSSIEFNYQQN